MTQETRKSNRWGIFSIAIIVVIILWLLNWILLAPQANRGTFGDMFGAVNALFSGLAFAGVIYTVWLQTKELALQREELQATREELRRAANAQEETKTALQRQVRLQALAAAVSANTDIAEVTKHYNARNQIVLSPEGKEAKTKIENLASEIEKELSASATNP